jgi:hypothetical protein
MGKKHKQLFPQQCIHCFLVVKNMKDKKKHDELCTKEKPAKRQHFVIFDPPARISLSRFDYDPGTNNGSW